MTENTEWTVATLKEFILRLFSEYDARIARLEVHSSALIHSQRNEINIAIQSVERLLQVAVKNTEDAVLKVEVANDKRFASVNEFRGALNDQQARMITRAEVEAKVDAVVKQTQDLTDRVNMMTGKGVGLNAGWVYLIAAIGAASALLSIWSVLRH